MKVLLCGYNWIGCKALELLLEAKHDVFVYTHNSPDHVNKMEDYCKKKNVKYCLDKIASTNLPFIPDLIISIYYRYIISDELIEICGRKIFNLHPSLLPRYKGCGSLTWAMINGEINAGYTYHYITTEVDGGNIILQKEIKIEDFDTQVTLYHRVMFEAIKDFKKVIELVLNNFPGLVQDKSLKTEYYKRGSPNNGMIEISWDDETKDRYIRAMIYPPLPSATYNGKAVYRLEDIYK